MTDVLGSTVVEVLVEAAPGFLVESAPVSTIIETAGAGTEIFAETTATETLTSTETETVYLVDPQIVLLDVGAQGPAGASGGASYPGTTITYTAGAVTEVLLYSDAAKTILAERRVLAYTFGKLTSVQFFTGDGTLSKTRTLTYTLGVLTSVSDT